MHAQRAGAQRRRSIPRVHARLPAVNQELSDEQLMQAYAAGDADAFERLYQRMRKPLFGFLLRGLRDRGMAEECFQDVWMRVIDARGRYQASARFSTWMFQIAHNRMVDMWRRQRPNSSLDDLPEGQMQASMSTVDTPEQEVDRFQSQRRLRDALSALPAEQCVALTLRLEQSLSLEEIGEVTGVGRETVKSRLRYAMDKLRQLLGEVPS